MLVELVHCDANRYSRKSHRDQTGLNIYCCRLDIILLLPSEMEIEKDSNEIEKLWDGIPFIQFNDFFRHKRNMILCHGYLRKKIRKLASTFVYSFMKLEIICISVMEMEF
jgi:hypothetical protein